MQLLHSKYKVTCIYIIYIYIIYYIYILYIYIYIYIYIFVASCFFQITLVVFALQRSKLACLIALTILFNTLFFRYLPQVP